MLKLPDSIAPVIAGTGENTNLKPKVIRKNETAAMIPRWVRALKPVWIVQHRLHHLAVGHFS